MITLRRFFIMLKRPLRQPVFLMMLFFLLFMTYLASRVPEDRRTSNIPVAVLNRDSSPEGQALTEELLAEESLFSFYMVESEEDMYRDLAKGTANTGYIIPEGFLARAARFQSEDGIRQVLSEGSLLPTVSMDVLFSTLFRLEAWPLLRQELEEGNLLSSENKEEIRALYTYYAESAEIFRVTDLSGTVYSHEISHHKSEIPVRKLCGFFLLAAGLLGLISYFHDRENQLYLRLTRQERAKMKGIHIVTSLLVPAAAAYPSILLTEEAAAFTLLGQLLLYMLEVTLFVWILSFMIRRSSTLTRILPLYLLLTLLLGGIFYDLGPYNPVLRFISHLFLPYYF